MVFLSSSIFPLPSLTFSLPPLAKSRERNHMTYATFNSLSTFLTSSRVRTNVLSSKFSSSMLFALLISPSLKFVTLLRRSVSSSCSPVVVNHYHFSTLVSFQFINVIKRPLILLLLCFSLIYCISIPPSAHSILLLSTLSTPVIFSLFLT